MGKSNYTILTLGLGSVLVLSLLMSHFLKAAERQRKSPVVQELTATFGDRFDRESRVTMQKGKKGESRRAEVTIFPVLGAGHQRLAHDVGQFVWRRFGIELDIGEVEVVCQRWGTDKPLRFEVPRPYLQASKPAAKKPSGRPAKAPKPKATAPGKGAPAHSKPGAKPAAKPKPAGSAQTPPR